MYAWTYGREKPCTNELINEHWKMKLNATAPFQSKNMFLYISVHVQMPMIYYRPSLTILLSKARTVVRDTASVGT